MAGTLYRASNSLRILSPFSCSSLVTTAALRGDLRLLGVDLDGLESASEALESPVLARLGVAVLVALTRSVSAPMSDGGGVSGLGRRAAGRLRAGEAFACAAFGPLPDARSLAASWPLVVGAAVVCMLRMP